MKTCFYIFTLFSFSVLSAQKIVQKTIIDAKETSIVINANNCFLVTIETAKTNQIKAEAKIDKAYSEDFVLNMHEEESTLFVDTGFNPNFVLPDDKLGVHKVMSMALHLTLPENLKATLYGTSTNVSAAGKYLTIDISFNDGICTLNNVTRSAKVFTQSGTIEVFTKAAIIEAASSFGEVVLEKIPKGNANFKLNAVTGNIRVYKTE